MLGATPGRGQSGIASSIARLTRGLDRVVDARSARELLEPSHNIFRGGVDGLCRTEFVGEL